MQQSERRLWSTVERRTLRVVGDYVSVFIRGGIAEPENEAGSMLCMRSGVKGERLKLRLTARDADNQDRHDRGRTD